MADQLTLLPELPGAAARAGTVYLMSDGYKLKWGYTSRGIRQRSGELRALVIGFMSGTRDDERDLHAMVKRWNVGGEWFSMPDDPAVFHRLRRLVGRLEGGGSDPNLVFDVICTNNFRRVA
jgi:hypothetical protein